MVERPVRTGKRIIKGFPVLQNCQPRRTGRDAPVRCTGSAVSKCPADLLPLFHDVMTSYLIKFDANYEDWLLKQQKIDPSWSQREDLCFIFFCVGMVLMIFILALEREEYQRWLRLKFSVACGFASALAYLAVLFYVEHFVPYCPLYITLLLPEIFSLMHLWILLHIKHQIDSEVGI